MELHVLSITQLNSSIYFTHIDIGKKPVIILSYFFINYCQTSIDIVRFFVVKHCCQWIDWNCIKTIPLIIATCMVFLSTDLWIHLHRIPQCRPMGYGQAPAPRPRPPHSTLCRPDDHLSAASTCNLEGENTVYSGMQFSRCYLEIVLHVHVHVCVLLRYTIPSTGKMKLILCKWFSFTIGYLHLGTAVETSHIFNLKCDRRQRFQAKVGDFENSVFHWITLSTS